MVRAGPWRTKEQETPAWLPESLARDLQPLVPLYKIRSVQPVDMFPHTAHVETVALSRPLRFESYSFCRASSAIIEKARDRDGGAAQPPEERPASCSVCIPSSVAFVVTAMVSLGALMSFSCSRRALRPHRGRRYRSRAGRRCGSPPLPRRAQ